MPAGTRRLHGQIHASLTHGVPCPDPSSGIIVRAFQQIKLGIETGALSMDDSLPQRLAALIELFDDSPDTVAALETQLQLVLQFDQRAGLVRNPATFLELIPILA